MSYQSWKLYSEVQTEKQNIKTKQIAKQNKTKQTNKQTKTNKPKKRTKTKQKSNTEKKNKQTNKKYMVKINIAVSIIHLII